MALHIGIVDTGVNPWHSHVRGEVEGCRIFVGGDGTLHEDARFHDPQGHGTAVAAIVRAAFPEARLYAVRVFEDCERTYPSLVARGLLRAAAQGCRFLNLSVAMPPAAGAQMLADACAAVTQAGCVIVAAARAADPGWLPAALPGVWGAIADDALAPGEVRILGPRLLAACGRPRDLAPGAACGNLRGPSFACAHALVHLARQADRGTP